MVKGVDHLLFKIKQNSNLITLVFKLTRRSKQTNVVQNLRKPNIVSHRLKILDCFVPQILITYFSL